VTPPNQTICSFTRFWAGFEDINDWEGDASDDLLAQVLAVSQQEYLENLKRNKSPLSSNETEKETNNAIQSNPKTSEEQ
jgi:hypothetical protein